MDPAAFAALLERCAPGAAVEPLTAIVRQASTFEPLLITLEGRKPIPIQAMSLEEGVQLATEATVAGQSVRIGLAQLGPEDRKQAGLTISASFDACRHVAAFHMLYQARLQAARANARDPEKAALTTIVSFVEKRSAPTPHAATRNAPALAPAEEPATERFAATITPAKEGPAWDVYRSSRGASIFVYER